MKTQSSILSLAVLSASALWAGPTSELYLTIPDSVGTTLSVYQGNSVNRSWSLHYGVGEYPVAVGGDVRTIGYNGSITDGGQYTLAGTWTGVTYSRTGSNLSYDSTTDGSYNYLVDFETGNVYRTDRDYSNPSLLFTVGIEYIGITYDAPHQSLWLSQWTGTLVAEYSLSGTLLSSFNSPHRSNTALAFDPADQTLWLSNNFDCVSGICSLEQYDRAGNLLDTVLNVPYAYGGEFNQNVPEPSTWTMLAAGLLLGVRRMRRRRAAGA